KKYRFIQLMYGVDKELKQSTPVISKKGSDTSQIGNDKSHYFTKLQLSDDVFTFQTLIFIIKQEKQVLVLFNI
ncbi:MAG: hypothetical protein PF437_10655, partial [Sulfurimonas sp.]|nr:hypothetical protein [Sulfurimonas sp.]